jgi:uncharacterized membrane protein YedE/YeeE
MTQPRKVVAFLDFGGAWDPSLAFVMLGAIAVHFVAQQLRKRRARPLLAARFSPIARTHIDAALVIGAALFGIGWGLSGFCPGPAVVSMGTGRLATIIFVLSMIAGMLLFRLVSGSQVFTKKRGGGAP